MAGPGDGILTDLSRRLMDKTMKEVNYFRHFETHDRQFKQDEQLLIRKLEEVRKAIEDAKRNNQCQIKGEVQDWIMDAGNVVEDQAEIRLTRFDSWCPLRQYRQGKRLAQRTLTMKDLIKRCNFERVAGPVELPYMKYHASRDFIDFESRKTKFKQLVEAFEDGNQYMIGLQGMGGTGKTTLATQVGKQVEESKAFEKVIFVVVSNPPDVNKIRVDIASQLGLKLEEKVQAERSLHLWTRISDTKKKLLIILDDVWEELNLKEIGIPFGLNHKNCYVLITTRHSRVCQVMKCQLIVRLHTLANEDALNLFLFHTGINDSKGIARDFVKECGGLPIAIVVLAKAFRNWPEGEWNVALTTLRDSKPLVDVDEDLVTVYTCLKLSYDHLNDKKAQELFLLCSIFLEDYEIPTSVVTRLGIGSGIFGEVDGYCAAKSQALSVKNKLIDCSLLLKVEETGCVKMHDLVREVAQWIAKEDIQTIMDSRTTLKENKRFVFWNVDSFPNQFDGAKLEILFLFISEKFPVKDIEAFFVGMTGLRVLFLHCKYGTEFRIPLWSLLSLNNIHTLTLDGWKFGDISTLKNIQSLVTLEFKNCLLIELPKDIMELKKLRWLGIRECEIQRNNPFEVIKRCLQLEELYFVGNYIVKDWTPDDDKEIGDEIVHDISPALQMFCIAIDGFECFAADDNGLSNCFNPQHMEYLISEAMFKDFMQRAQVLELGKIGLTRQKCLVPDIIPIEDGGMDNLMKLCLYERADIECLIDNSNYRYSNITVFSKLVELHLYGVGVKELYWGAMPSGFLRQLEILKLEECVKLQSLFLDENLQLHRLQVMELIDCPILQPSIFQPSIAKSLLQSKKEHKSLIAYESSQEEPNSQNNYGLFLPELKSLQIEGCGKLEMVWPLIVSKDLPKLKDLHIRDCTELKYIFGEYRDMGQVLQQEVILLEGVPSFISIFQKFKKFIPRPPQVLKEDPKEKHETSKTSAFSWAHGCCFLAPTKDTKVRFSTTSPEHRIILQESCVSSSKRIETFHIREMTLVRCSKLKSLFSVSIVTTIMLEKLHIWKCEELKDIITNEAKDDDHLNCTSIFPKLQSLEVYSCNKLEFIFPSTLSGGLQKLKSIDINGAEELKYVFGKHNEEKCVSNENENDQLQIHLPALETLSVHDVRKMINICAKTYYLSFPSLQCLKLGDLQVFNERSFQYWMASLQGLQLNMTAPKGSCATECLMRQPLSLLHIRQMRLWRCSKLKSLFNVSIATTMILLETLYIEECEELKDIIINEAEDDDHLNYTSIFPRLQSLEVYSCNKLEFIFPSTLSGGLQKLKSIYIEGAPELKYVFGKHNEEECASNENENNDEPHIHLPALDTLSLQDVPNMINIGVKKYQVKCSSLQIVEALKGSCATKCLMRHPLSLQNIREMTLTRCSKLTSLFSVSIATTIMLEKLYIFSCEELKDIITNEAEDDDHLDCTSIFPNLQIVEVNYCNKLEFIFPSTLSGGLQKLKSIYIYRADELKYVFGKHNNEECASNENENNDPHIYLPALESLYVNNVPNMISIGIKKYQVKCSSLEIVEAPKGSCATECLMRQPLSLQNIREMTLKRCSKLKSLFSVSIATTMIMLETLYIEGCEELKDIITNEADDDDHLSCTSIFPKLQSLEVFNCNKLEFIFPSTLSGGLQKLKYIDVDGAEELKYVFGKHNEEECVSNENENDLLQIHLPALETLSVHDVCKMINICAKKDYLSFPSLQSLELGDLQEFNQRSFLHLMASLQGLQLNVTNPKDWMKIIKDVQKLTKLEVSFLKIEEVLDLEGVEIEGPELTLSLEELSLINLSELRHIWKGPKYILSLLNLSQLNISACKKLRAIFSISIVKSLPQLSYLEIEDCDKLVDIIEENLEDHLRQLCFPKLESILIKCCNSLKCLFSILKPAMFPELTTLKIEENSELEKVFKHKQDDMQKMTIMEEVFPKLSRVILSKLPMLITICEGIDFQSPEVCEVDDCPKYQGTNHIREESENGDSKNLAATNVLPDFAESSKGAIKTSVEEAVSSMELEDEHKTIESTTQFQREDLAETKTAIETSYKINPPLDDYSIDVILKERSEQVPTLEDVAVADLKPRNSSDLKPSKSRSETSMTHQQELTDMMIINVTSSFVSQVGGLQSDPSTLAYKETEKEVGKAIPALSLPATTSPDFEVIVGQPRIDQNLSCIQNIPKDTTLAQVASMKEKHEQGSQGDDATSKVVTTIQSTDSESMKQIRVSSIIAQSLEEIEKEAVRRQASQLQIAPTSTNLKSAKEKAKGVYESSTATDTSPVATPFQSKFTREPPVKEARDQSSVHKEAESENPIKAVLPQVVPSLHHQSQIADNLGICEIFRLVELKHGETALLAQALEQYPQLLLPREHRTHRIIAWSYRVLVDILVMLATKTPNTITPSEKSTLEANLSEAIVLGFDKGWVESVRAKVFGVDMSNVSKAKEEIQVMEVKLGDIDSQLLVLSEDRKKLIESMTMFGDMISAKDKPFGI